MRSARPVMWVALLASVALAGTACGSSGQSSGSTESSSAIPPGAITVCYSAPESGPEAVLGKYVPQEAQLAAKIVNEQYGGIAGHQVKVDVEDDGSNVTQGVEVMQKFVARHKANPNDCAYVAQISMDPTIAPQQAAVLSKAKLITTSPQSPDEYFEPQKWPYFFSINPSDKALAEVVAKFLDSHGLTKAAVLTDNIPQANEYVQDIVNQDKSQGGSLAIVKTASIAPGATQVATQLAQLRAANPNVLIVATELGDGPIWQALHAMNWSPTIMGDGGFFYDGYSSLGSLGTQAWAPCWQGLSNDPTLKLPQKVIDLVNQIGPLTAASYPDPLIATGVEMEEILVAKYAIEKAKSLDSDKLKAAFESMRNVPILWAQNQFTYTSSYHNGIVGPYGAGVCSGAPLGKIGNNLNIFKYADSVRATS